MKRDTRPMFIGAIINGMLGRFGAKTSDSDLGTKWNEIVGGDSELIKISRGVKDRTVYIRTKNPAARLLLSYQSDEIIEKINGYFGYNAVGKVVVR